MLIVLAGLPGTGKTTLATLLARRTGATHIRIDSIEAAMATSTLRIHPAQDAGYMVGYAVAEDNLRLGRTVIADSVNPITVTRAAWRDTAQRVGTDAVDVEVVCSDPTEHRRRIEGRRPDIPGLVVPTWQAVLLRHYEPWDTGRLIVDTAHRQPDDAADQTLRQLGLAP